MLTRIISYWKFPALLLAGIGLSNIGAWIYFIALNLIVLQLTESPLALSVLYIIRPIAGVLTNLWAGSVIDRVDKRKLMIMLDIFRAIILVFLLLFPHIIVIYVVTLIVQIASHVFGNTSFAYITKLVPEEQRPRFNSLHSLIGSGAFIIGPAVTGVLFIIGTPQLAILINIIILVISGLVTLLLPSVDDHLSPTTKEKAIPVLQMIKEDVIHTINYYRFHIYVMYLCIFFGGLTVVLATAVDSLEASFATLELHLSESKYGFLVSIAGIGMAIGAILNVVIVKKVKVTTLLNIGVLGNAIGYCVYAFSYSFTIASVGFFILSFFLAFANSAFMTIYQNHIKVDILGRVGAFNGLIESILIIILTATFGFMADMIAIRPFVIAGTLSMLILSLAIIILNRKKTL